MTYNNEKTIRTIRTLIHMIQGDATEVEEINLEQSSDDLDRLWRLCECIMDTAEDARTLIGKIIDEREDMEAENEGE